MEVRSSEYLQRTRELLKKLVERLQEDYAYASVLGMDNRARQYSIRSTGITAGPSPRFTSRGFVARVRDERGYAEYSFNHIDEDAVEEIARIFREELIPLGSKVLESGTFSSMERKAPEEEAMTLRKSTEYEIWPYDFGDEKIFEVLKGIREQAKAYDPRILDCGASYVFQEIHKIFISGKKDLEQNLLWSSGSVNTMAPKGQEIVMSFQGYSGLVGAELLETMDKDVENVAKTSIELLSAEAMVPGEYDCVCTPSVTGMIVHEAFGHGVEMDMFVKDRALAKHFIGEYVASPLVTMHDGAAVMQETGSYFFDDDGNIAKDTVIIDKGILKTGMIDELSAEVLDIPTTGNGRRESYERKAYTRMTNTYFEGGTDSVEDMIASIDYGFLLDQPTSGMEDPKNWGIQCMVNFAREIRDGKLTGKIFSPIVLTGYVPDLLKSITMMSPDVELEGGGMCGKGYKEWVKVSDGGPYIKARIRLG
ncbi:MAG: TldD/PmbA family protein [Lachnospiraceae bacterium]|nr:TldD/PmbA family protein [Lachnospiraceae bacterium]